MNLLNNIFNIDNIEINKTSQKYLIVFTIILSLLLIALLVIKKDYYYENRLLINSDRILLLVDKDMINKVKEEKSIIVNGIKSDYSINKIIDNGDICYIDIQLGISIENISDIKYKLLLGKEGIFEYIIRIIKKVS